MGMHMVHYVDSPETCLCCQLREALGRIYLQRARLQPLFCLLQICLLRFWLHISVLGPTKLWALLANLLLAPIKLAI